jgi:hypothetical protein
MKAQYIATQAGNHGIDYVTESGKKGFVIGILDEKTARTLAAGPELLEIALYIFDEINDGAIDEKNGISINSNTWHKLKTAIEKATQP